MINERGHNVSAEGYGVSLRYAFHANNYCMLHLHHIRTGSRYYIAPNTCTHARASLVWYNNCVSKPMCTCIYVHAPRRVSIAGELPLPRHISLYKCVIEHQIHVYYIPVILLCIHTYMYTFRVTMLKLIWKIPLL